MASIQRSQDAVLTAVLAGDFDWATVPLEGEGAPVVSPLLEYHRERYREIEEVVKNLSSLVQEIYTITHNTDRITFYSAMATAIVYEQRMLKPRLDSGESVNLDPLEGMVSLLSQTLQEDKASIASYEETVKQYLETHSVALHIVGSLNGGEERRALYERLVVVCERARIEVQSTLLTGNDALGDPFQAALRALREVVVPDWHQVAPYIKALQRFQGIERYMAYYAESISPKKILVYNILHGVCRHHLALARERLFENPFSVDFYTQTVNQLYDLLTIEVWRESLGMDESVLSQKLELEDGAGGPARLPV